MATVAPSRNKMLQAAWDGLRRDERAAKKAAPAEPAEVHTEPAKATRKAPAVHKKAGKAPAAKKKGGRK